MSEIIPLTKNQLIQIRYRGYSYIMTTSGLKKITVHDLCIDQETVEFLKKEYGIYPNKKIGEI